jgi:hypothetical protein
MGVRTAMKVLPVLVLLVGGAALAQGAGSGAGGASSTGGTAGAGTTSGTASGSNVEPSTAIQKQNTGRSAASEKELQGSSNAAGAPAVEGHPGTQSGSLNENHTNPMPK